eukprot:6203361-Pleurochrysis_carterae.AAC.2
MSSVMWPDTKVTPDATTRRLTVPTLMTPVRSDEGSLATSWKAEGGSFSVAVTPTNSPAEYNAPAPELSTLVLKSTEI